MSKGKERDIIKIIFKNLINSLKPRQFKGNLMGKDYFGNKFYEIPPDNRSGNRNRPTRWFEPEKKDAFDQELAAEWEAWLRGRRKEIPTQQEIIKNLGIMQKKKNFDLALKNDKNTLKEEIDDTSFPNYKDENYESVPGKQNSK